MQILQVEISAVNEDGNENIEADFQNKLILLFTKSVRP